MIPSVVAFVPSNETNNTYSGIIPSKLIHRELTREKIERIWEDQQKRARLYNVCHDEEELARVISYMKGITQVSHVYYAITRAIQMFKEQAQRKIDRVDADRSMNFADKSDLINRIKDQLQKDVVETYRRAIVDNQSCLSENIQDRATLTIIKYININPRMAIVFDDCLDTLDIISSKTKNRKGEVKASVMDTIFQQGRHFYLTVIITAQTDIKINTTLRRNAFINIFTEPQCASHFFNNKANSLDKKRVKRAEMICNSLFSNTSAQNFKKFVYYRLGNDINMFSYTIADRYPSFRFGHPSIWKICEHIEKKQKDNSREFLENMV
jgi:hypothetical protein